jgi:glycosyltransferase involved in cell wall biosynthesis
MFCSIIIPTIGRPTVQRAISSVVCQTLPSPEFEIIVVNDSGTALPPAQWQHLHNVQLIETNQRAQSIARNVGATLAKGDYLNFLDDDDWLLPNALGTFWALTRQKPDAGWLYGGMQIVDSAGKVLGGFNPGLDGNCFTQLVAGVWVPLQASLIKSEVFFSVGGFHPLFRMCEETELGRRVAFDHEFAGTPTMVACLLRGSGWKSSQAHADGPNYNRWSREIALNQTGVFGRLRRSATTSYWHGRILQAYLASAQWNWRQKKFSMALSRIIHGLASLLIAGRSVFSAAYWRALKDDQVPNSAGYVLLPLGLY